VSPEEYLKRAQEAGQLGSIYAEVRRGKAIASVLRRAKVADESGNEVDIEQLFGPLNPPAPETSAVQVDAAATNAEAAAAESVAAQSGDADAPSAAEDGDAESVGVADRPAPTSAQ
jgi:hypothetical protein